jgi:hypothetical protein
LAAVRSGMAECTPISAPHTMLRDYDSALGRLSATTTGFPFSDGRTVPDRNEECVHIHVKIVRSEIPS